MKNTFKYMLWSAILPLYGCSDDFHVAEEGSESQLPIMLKATYPTATRASDSGFEGGDRIGLFVLDYDGESPQDMAANPHARNVRFEFDDTDNTCKGVTDIYWTSATTPADLIAYYPFRSEINNPNALRVNVERRQDTEGTEDGMGGYESSDFLYAKLRKVIPTSSAVPLTFNHAFAGVRISLVMGDNFDASEWSRLDKSVTILNTVIDGTIDLNDGTVTPGNARSSIIPLRYGEDFRAVTMPQRVDKATPLLSISVGTEGYTFSKNTELNFVAGKMHSFTISVNKKSDGSYEFKFVTMGITDWIDSVDFRDGLMKQYVVVNVETPGSLKDAVEGTGLIPHKIYNLKLRGNLNGDDFLYIRENIQSLKALNLYETKVENFVDHGGGNAGIEKDLLPGQGLLGMSTLTHFIYPRYVREIGGEFFRGSGIMGDVIIPEGVEIIGWGAFLDCKSIRGVSLPKTLREIGGEAFEYSSLSGEIALPENLKAIREGAFNGCSLTGELRFPEKIEYLGEGAFAGCNFTGSLVFPQGIKEVPARCFGGFTGTLALPEGVEIIGGEAFIGCHFRGELKLPSTVKEIGNSAFSNNLFSNIIFPENLLSLGNRAFANCSRLAGALQLPEKLTVIRDGAFEDCTLLDEIILPKNIVKIEAGAFANCYNLTSIISFATEPPLLKTGYIEDGLGRPYYPFSGVPKDNFTVQVPAESVEAYKCDSQWKEFKRISAYSNFICRPVSACALNSIHNEDLILNADGAWTVESKPEWVTLSATSGTGKAEIRLTFTQLPEGSDDREGEVVFRLVGEEGFTTTCKVVQKNYQYAEDQCVTLQTHTLGRGIDVVFVGDGWDAAAIADGSYLEQVKRQMEYFFALEPYTTYRDYFNVRVCFSLSQEVGVNTANTWRNTKFMIYYAPPGGSNSGTLDCHDPDAVFDYVATHAGIATHDMWRSLVVMSLNSDEYGSNSVITDSGASIAIVGRTEDPYPMDSRGLMQREACGIAFGKLANERANIVSYLNKNERAVLSDYNSRGWYMNLSLNGSLNEVWWHDFIFDLEYSDKVDVFEGGLGKTRGCFRSEINSCMNYGIPYFSLAARYDIVKRILGYAEEEFSVDKFRQKDSDEWGSTQTTKAPGDFTTTIVSYNNSTKFYKSRKY